MNSSKFLRPFGSPKVLFARISRIFSLISEELLYYGEIRQGGESEPVVTADLVLIWLELVVPNLDIGITESITEQQNNISRAVEV